jgi:ATP-dependent HslUV protease subunit HslV
MKVRSTTIIAVRRDGVTAMAADGQVTIGETIQKTTANKLRTMRDGKIVVGFAGAVADALTLFDRLESKLDQYSGNLQRAIYEMGKDWRMDRVLRRLEALMIVADKDSLFLASGTGDIIVPDEDLLGIGSGGPYATAAARAMLRHTSMTAQEIAEESLRIAAEICIYTNDQIRVEVLQ